MATLISGGAVRGGGRAGCGRSSLVLLSRRQYSASQNLPPKTSGTSSSGGSSLPAALVGVAALVGGAYVADSKFGVLGGKLAGQDSEKKGTKIEAPAKKAKKLVSAYNPRQGLNSATKKSGSGKKEEASRRPRRKSESTERAKKEIENLGKRLAAATAAASTTPTSFSATYSREQVDEVTAKIKQAEKRAMEESIRELKEEIEALGERFAAAAPVRVESPSESKTLKMLPKETKSKKTAPTKERRALEDIRSEIRAVRSDAESTRADKVKRLEAEVRADLEVVLSEDLTTLDEAGLRRRIVQLVLELRDRNKWEALRLHELTKLHTAELASKYEILLKKQEANYEDVVRQESLAASERAVEVATRTIKEAHEQTLAEIDAKWKTFTHERLKMQQENLREEMSKRVSAVQDEAADALAAERSERAGKLAALRAEANAMRNTVERTNAFLSAANEFHKTILAADALESAFVKAAPLKDAASSLRAHCKKDPVLHALLRALPERSLLNGPSTMEQLSVEYEKVREQSRRAAILADTKGGEAEKNGQQSANETAQPGIGQRMLARVTSSLTFASKGMVEGDSAESRLARAGYYLETGNLVAAVREIDALDDAAKVPASHWLILAKERLAAQQAIKLARAHVKCTAETFVKSYGQ